MQTTKVAWMSKPNGNAAPTLHWAGTMKSIIVGLLAVSALTGCGVGMDDPEGQQVVSGSTTSALRPAAQDNAAGAQVELRAPVGQDPRTWLPQDPIPTSEARTYPTQPPRPTR